MIEDNNNLEKYKVYEENIKSVISDFSVTENKFPMKNLLTNRNVLY